MVLPDRAAQDLAWESIWSQCTYRGAWCSLTCAPAASWQSQCLNAPTGAWCSLTRPADRPASPDHLSQCTYRCVVLPDVIIAASLINLAMSQCTYRCVVLPDPRSSGCLALQCLVSMHLQVRGAP